VADRVEFAGACDRRRVADLLARAAIFALPSRREAFSIAVLEARAAGLPVVARDSGGVSEVVQHGRQGFLAGSRADFADAIVRLVSDAARRERFARDAAAGLDAFSWGQVVARHEEVYRQATDAHRSARGELVEPRVECVPFDGLRASEASGRMRR